jgi:hypothetical protein
MKDLERRLRGLERRFGITVEETDSDRCVAARLEAAYRRTGYLPRSPEHLARLRGMGLIAILIAGRERARQAGLDVADERRVSS